MFPLVPKFIHGRDARCVLVYPPPTGLPVRYILLEDRFNQFFKWRDAAQTCAIVKAKLSSARILLIFVKIPMFVGSKCPKSIYFNLMNKSLAQTTACTGVHQ